VLYRDDGTPIVHATVRAWLEARERRAGLEVQGSLHKLRHTFCSHLAMCGAPAKAIQDLAGRENLMTMLRYMHLSPSARRSAMSRSASHERFEKGVTPTGIALACTESSQAGRSTRRHR